MAELRSAFSRTVMVSVHGAAGVLDLVVPSGATVHDVAREYAQQAGLGSIPVLQEPGRLLRADQTLTDAGIRSGTVLVAATGLLWPGRRRAPATWVSERDHVPLVTGAAGAAGIAAGFVAGASGPTFVRFLTAAVLALAAVVSAWPDGVRLRAVVAPAFAAAAVLAVGFRPDTTRALASIALALLVATVVAGSARMSQSPPDPLLDVWLAVGVVGSMACGVPVFVDVPAPVVWTCALFGAVLAVRWGAPLMLRVPDRLVLDSLTVSPLARNAHDVPDLRPTAVRRAAVERWVARATRGLLGGSVAVLVVVVPAAPLLVWSVEEPLDRLGVWVLLANAGGILLLSAHLCRHLAASVLLRAAGGWCWASLVLAVVLASDGTPHWTWPVTQLAVGWYALALAVAVGRGWRWRRWDRFAAVAEAFLMATSVTAVALATGLVRWFWDFPL